MIFYTGNCFDFDPKEPIGAVVTVPPIKVYYSDTRDHLVNTDWLDRMKIMARQVIICASPGVNWPKPDVEVKWIHEDFESRIVIYGNWKGPGEFFISWPFKSAYGHGSVQPVELFMDLIRYTEGVIFDPFMGSGSCAVACAKLGRRFIGCEIEEKHVRTAEARVAEVLSAA